MSRFPSMESLDDTNAAARAAAIADYGEFGEIHATAIAETLAELRAGSTVENEPTSNAGEYHLYMYIRSFSPVASRTRSRTVGRAQTSNHYGANNAASLYGRNYRVGNASNAAAANMSAPITRSGRTRAQRGRRNTAAARRRLAQPQVTSQTVPTENTVNRRTPRARRNAAGTAGRRQGRRQLSTASTSTDTEGFTDAVLRTRAVSVGTSTAAARRRAVQDNSNPHEAEPGGPNDK